jgi:hypothetical protein
MKKFRIEYVRTLDDIKEENSMDFRLCSNNLKEND